jgi:hypothetical protein
MPRSDLEPLLERLRAEASTDSSAESLIAQVIPRQRESSSDDEDETVAIVSGGAQAEEEPDPVRIDMEEDTEHEPIQREHIAEMRGVHPSVTEKMTELAELLGSKEPEEGEDSEKLNRLESLLQSFGESETPREVMKRETLQDPLLLLLAQQRVFRMCRNSFFCPHDDCRCRIPIRSLTALALHLQVQHGARKQETEDMVPYFLVSLLPDRPQIRVKTMEGREVNSEWNVRRCRYPECQHLS